MLGVQLGVDDAPRACRRTSSGVGGGPATGWWTGAPGSSGFGRSTMRMTNKNRLDLENMPAGGYRQARWPVDRPARGAEGAGRRDPVRDVPRAGPLDRGRCRPRTSPSALGLHANTVRLHLERLREAGLVDVEAVHRGTVGRPQHLYFLAAGAPALGFDPPAHALLAGLLAALAERVGADANDAAETGRVWGAEAGRRTRSRSCLHGARAASSPGSGSSPRPSRRRRATRAARGSTSCTARSASWPRPTPSWCATCTGGCARASSIPWAGEALRSSRRCTTLSHATSWSGSGILTTTDSTRGVPRCSLSRTPAPSSPHATPPPTRCKALIEAEGNPELVLRVAVRPGGCSGLSYEMFFDTDVAADDVRTEHGGVTVVIDPASAAAPRRRVARLQGRPPGRRVRDQQPERHPQLRLRPVVLLSDPACPVSA